jgi:hypothetical protein
MAQRARRALPTVEPRSTPLYATLPAEFGGGFADAASAAAGIEQTVNDAPPFGSDTDKARRRQRRPPEERDRPRTRIGGDPPVAGVRSPLPDRFPRDADVQANSGQREVSESPPPRVQGDRQGTDVADGSRGGSRAESPAPGSAAPARNEHSERLAVREVATVVVNEDDETPVATGLSGRPEPRQADLEASERSTVPLTAGSQQTEEARTEIHISIGSIELRAARNEPRPQPAPFRPRVSLDEFLGRRS